MYDAVGELVMLVVGEDEGVPLGVNDDVALFDGVTVVEPDREFVSEPVTLDEGVGVTEAEAPLEIVAVDEAVPLGVNDEVALFDDERVGLTERVPLRVMLLVTVPERELVSEGV